MEATTSTNSTTPRNRRQRRAAHRFVVAGLLGLGLAALSVQSAAAIPLSGGPEDFEVPPFEPDYTLPELEVPDIEVPDFELPEVPEITLPEFDEPILPPDITIPPDFTIPPFDPGDDPVDPVDPGEDPEDPDEPVEPGDDPEDPETPDTPDGYTTETVAPSTTAPGARVESASEGEELAYTGNDSALPLVGAGLVVAGGLVAGLAVLARRSAERDQVSES